MIEHKYIDIEYVRNNPNEKWDKYWLSCNRKLTIKDVETLILPNSIDEWKWSRMSRYINMQQVRDNPDKPWDKLWLSSNKQLTVKDIDTLILPKSIDNWDWQWISIYIDIQEVINNPNRSWIRGGLESNNECTNKILEFFDAGLLKHLQKNIPQFKYHTDIIVKCEC